MKYFKKHRLALVVLTATFLLSGCYSHLEVKSDNGLSLSRTAIGRHEIHNAGIIQNGSDFKAFIERGISLDELDQDAITSLLLKPIK